VDRDSHFCPTETKMGRPLGMNGSTCFHFFTFSLSSFSNMFVEAVAVALVALWFFLLRPRKGGKDAPPVVTSSPVVPIPFIGVICEFFKGPNDMMKRCHRDYGPVFTIPVRRILVHFYVE
jgi:hypothetical protein